MDIPSVSIYLQPVAAGFPSPADDFVENTLDLNEHLIRHPVATFLVRAVGDSMIGAQITSDDILIVDRSLTPRPHDIVIAVIDGSFTVKRLRQKNNAFVLAAENPDYPDITISEGDDAVVWGVVTWVLHQAK
ncbi:translesion error-prone DNA polymerase V autoproteolytic subunit [candidate division WWE3 bacterium]|uniref:Translesion error-prone DNA polymerase V autoproteolytic subunit n=1 Tax=candidate division WWE3 bacterium TaxID=2053526 RepID=A0A955LFY6_UNCKA|nr:translesion error-prone DNA polymerase V autoproteolytic subunit [candidate division WWE3 bacterium]